jgi:hypothetical protein
MQQQTLLIAVIGLATTGCQSSDESAAPIAVTPVAAALSPVESPAAVATQGGDATSMADTSKPTKNAKAEFDPPFPQRTELFAPPRGGQAIVRRDSEHGGAIELKGFVDVNGPRVVLAIDGELSPLAVGGEKHGVQVISIDPPHAVLQRGRSRWTASLE